MSPNSGAFQPGTNISVSWTASDTDLGSTPITIQASIDNGTSWTTLASSIANSGSQSVGLPNQETTQLRIRVIAQDLVGNIGSDSSDQAMVIDGTPPVFNSFVINNGNTFTGTSFVMAQVNVSDNASSLQVRVAEANALTNDCQSEYADNSWYTYSVSNTTQDIPALLSAGDGTKKLCGWAKDAAGNVSTIASPSSGTQGVNTDTIEFQIGNPPVVESFTVTNNTAGPRFGTSTYNSDDTVLVTWSVTDIEGLDTTTPVELSYTTDGSSFTNVTLPPSGLSGTVYSYSSSITISAPSTSFFRFKIRANDIAGNTSIAVLSDSQNSGNWSVYAGSNEQGIGGSALSALVSGFYDYSGRVPIAIDPRTNDLYAIDTASGIVRLDARTGRVSLFMQSGSFNLPDSGPIPSPASGSLAWLSSINFDRNGYFYLQYGTRDTAGGVKIYQFNLVNQTVRLYAGGGTTYDNSATPTTVYVAPAPFTFDEDNSLYFGTSCIAAPVPSGYPGPSGTFRLMKLTQNPDGTPGTVSVVAGNCVRGSPTSGSTGVDAISSPFMSTRNINVGSLAVWNSGATIYYNFWGESAAYKILNGVTYQTNLSRGRYGLLYSRFTNKLYQAASTGIEEWTPNLTGANGDTVSPTLFAASSGTGDCSYQEGIPASSACVAVNNGFALGSAGQLFFVDGPIGFERRPYRVRYRDNQSRIRTLLGTIPFFKDGLHKAVIRGSISGIYYKTSSEPNQASFPAGLYFTDRLALVFGRIDPTTGNTSIIWGNQQGFMPSGVSNYPSGTILGPDVSMGGSNSLNNNGSPLIFDPDGLPWTIYSDVVVSLDNNRQVVRRQSGGNSWQSAAEGSAPGATSISPYGGLRNLALKGSTVFFLGGRLGANNTPLPATMRALDFLNNSITTIMGLNVTVGGTSPDSSTPGSVQPLSLATTCQWAGSCYFAYRSSDDRIYFSEGSAIRYITSPSDTSQSTLGTLLSYSGSIANFTFRPDGSQLYFINGSALRCHDISSGAAYCDKSNLAPSSAMGSLGSGANQFTWIDNNTLLVSTYNGYVFQYKPDG